MAFPEVTVIIPTRNRPRELAACLTALQAQTFPADKFEVLVCDDGSTEELKSIVASFEPVLNLRYLSQPQKGPAAARNLGIRHAQAVLVAMTDSDTLPQRDWLEKLVEALNANPQAIGAEGKVTAERPEEFAPLGEGPTNLTGGVYLTCNCAYRREVLIKAGGFDESFPYPAYEDVELAARTQQWGEIVWQPDAVVYHPRRPLTAATVLKKLRHWEYVLIMGCRYGYLGWRRYPVKSAALRVMLLSLIALPLSKLKDAFCWLLKKPFVALKLGGFGVLESLGALWFVFPCIVSGSYKKKIKRQNYLSEPALSK
ncbi:MAG: glycosyltransferase [Acidobacteria bacterium]|nr:glycosyltransferase [Acidobacteriota bacterium]